MRAAIRSQKNGPDAATIQQTLSEGAEPVSKSASTPLVCRDQEDPPSLGELDKTAPAGAPMTLEPGGEIKRGLEISVRLPRKRSRYSWMQHRQPAAGCEGGAAGAADAAFIFFGSAWPSGAGPGIFAELELD